MDRVKGNRKEYLFQPIIRTKCKQKIDRHKVPWRTTVVQILKGQFQIT